jgi:hypothetical protein
LRELSPEESLGELTEEPQEEYLYLEGSLKEFG